MPDSTGSDEGDNPSSSSVSIETRVTSGTYTHVTPPIGWRVGSVDSGSLANGHWLARLFVRVVNRVQTDYASQRVIDRPSREFARSLPDFTEYPSHRVLGAHSLKLGEVDRSQCVLSHSRLSIRDRVARQRSSEPSGRV